MADITLLHGKQYVRAKVKELKADELHDVMLTIDFNLAVDKVQQDLIDIGIKQWTKTAYLTGPICSAPTDLMPIPNAIRDMKTSGGVKATLSTNLTGTHNDITYTAREPGTPGNSINIIYLDSTALSNLTVVTNYASSPKTITVYFDSGLPADEISASLVVAAINADVLASTLVSAALKTSNDGTGAIIAMSSTALSGGSGSGWKPADEIDIIKKNRIDGDYIQQPTLNFPKYCLIGDSATTPVRKIEFLPKTITYSIIEYWYSIAEMTADTDYINIPHQYRDFVYMEVIRKAYETLEMTSKRDNMALMYAAKLNELEKKYQKSLSATVQEKMRLESSDVNS